MFHRNLCRPALVPAQQNRRESCLQRHGKNFIQMVGYSNNEYLYHIDSSFS